MKMLDQVFQGSPWHGPSVREALEGVSAEQAAVRPIPRAHTIGELVLHMATWKRAVASRLAGVPKAPSEAENFPPFEARDWARAQDELSAAHAAVRAAIRRLTPARLVQPAVKGGSACYLQAHGILDHDVWHAGQILILRRALQGD